jgi:hypothetical protein
MTATELEETLNTLQKSVKDMAKEVRSVCGFVEDIILPKLGHLEVSIDQQGGLLQQIAQWLQPNPGFPHNLCPPLSKAANTP